ncbi:MAG: NAD-dependent epimerase/dehydratase family protein [Candidatus Nitronauta litoralis]|uniref:NAD-dependent epimerase/dehydratase family protein n=1 Tax=Candidatus Nitronauta litoralis TaxID=2705533 RepID=A0A7T0G072_9BACT|nr:MAG: NAD-dependent epimerase/dehydratase family protein [Candidatus Nitronauta litoralis]
MKTVLVTGGAGFIGSNFLRHLHQRYPEYQILLLDALTYAGNLDNIPESLKHSGQFEFFQGNITQSELVQKLVQRSDVVIHFAAESHVAKSIYDNSIFFETDVIGTHVIADAIAKYPVERFIHISTSEVYGTALTEPMDENHPLNPMTPYAAAKAGADRLVYAYRQTYDIPAVIIRPFNNYGPCQHLEKAVPNFIVSALLDQPLTVHGMGEASRDWMFVEDTCRGLDAVMHAPIDTVSGQTINLGTGSDTSVLDIARLVLELTNKPSDRIEFTSDRPGQVTRHISSTAKAQALLDWKHTVNLKDGLARTVEFYRDNRSWWERFLWMKDAWKPKHELVRNRSD